MLGALLLSASLLAGPAPQNQNAGSLRGFDAVVVNTINAAMGTTRLPSAMGFPVQPGMAVTVTADGVFVFDERVANLSGGRADESVVAGPCVSNCPAALFNPFRNVWLRTAEEAQSVKVDLPTRVLMAADSAIPARTLILTAYAIGESRPAEPPSFALLLNGGQAGLRARPFYLMPPRGVQRAPGDRILGLRVKISGGGSFKVDALDPRFDRVVNGSGPGELAAVLKDIRKRHPGKDAIILHPDDSASVADLVAVMVLAQKSFPKVVLGTDFAARPR